MVLLAGLLLVPGALRAQGTDSLLVEVRLAGVGRMLLMGWSVGETLWLPAGPIFALAGRGPAPVPVATPDQLGELLGVTVT